MFKTRVILEDDVIPDRVVGASVGRFQAPLGMVARCLGGHAADGNAARPHADARAIARNDASARDVNRWEGGARACIRLQVSGIFLANRLHAHNPPRVEALRSGTNATNSEEDVSSSREQSAEAA